MLSCTAACCRHGVYADVKERDKILAHAETIQRYLEPHQEKDPARWFEAHEIVDDDFPSGRAIGTQFRDCGCVFLDSVGRCTLQKTAVAEGMGKYSLKPFFCAAYPITVNHGKLAVDQAEFASRPQCCGFTPGGALDVFAVCEKELEYVLGKDGVEELSEWAIQREQSQGVPEDPI